jgi:hypothetical protein
MKRAAFLIVLFIASLGASIASAQQMPDPKQMSGMPLPVPDVPVGTVSARVIRGALTNPIAGIEVELQGADKKAKTDEAGRATFSGLAPGSRVKAVVVVGSERIESQEFAVPTVGGIRVMLVATDAEIEKKAEADRALAQGPAVQGAVVFSDQSRFVLEVHDDALNVFNMFEVENTAKRPVQTDGPLVFVLPDNAQGVGMLEGSTPNAVAAGKKVTVNGPFAPGKTVVQFAYSIPLGAETIEIAQKLPAPMTQVSVVAQKIGAMQMASPQLSERREMPADGQVFILGQGGALKAGDTVTLTLSGLPHRSTWPASLALAIAAVIVAAGAWGAVRGRRAEPSSRRAQLQARREKLLSELTTLEEQRRKGTVDARVYATRREHLVTALEDLYAGLEREVA